MSGLAGAELIDEAGRRKFRVIRKLGAGGFAEVWLASLLSPSGLERRVALKLLHSTHDEALQAAGRLRDEARVLASLHHPVILEAHDLVQLGDRVALVMEFVDGQDLGACIRHPTDPIPLGPLLEVVGHVASALDAAWRELGLVHRDVKPGNIRVGRYGDVKLLDFGIARSELMLRHAQTSMGLLGSPGYLAPERFVAERPPHPGSDVFALGCVLYEGATRQPLFSGMDLAMIYGLAASPERLGAFVAQKLAQGVPDRLGELLTAVLAHDPEARPNAARFAQQCDAALASLGEPSALRTWCRAHSWPQVEEPRVEGPRVDEPRPEALRRPPSHPPQGAPAAPPPPPEVSEPAAEDNSRSLLLAEPPAGPAPAPGRPRLRRLALLLVGLGAVAAPLALLIASIATLSLGYVATSAVQPAPVPVLSPLQGPVAHQSEAPPPSAPVEAPAEPAEPPEAPAEPVAEIAPEPSPLPSPSPAPAAAPAAAGLGAPDTALVSVLGPPGELSVDGQVLGETNVSYRLPIGAHRCRFVGQGLAPVEFPCEVRASSRTLLVPAARVSIDVDNDLPVQLRDAAGKVIDPREVPSGERYLIFADFGQGWQEAGQITVSPSGPRTIRCNQVRAMCTAGP